VKGDFPFDNVAFVCGIALIISTVERVFECIGGASERKRSHGKDEFLTSIIKTYDFQYSVPTGGSSCA
jgi:hypothetical protein